MAGKDGKRYLYRLVIAEESEEWTACTNPNASPITAAFPWLTTPGGLRVVDMLDVPSKAKEPKEEREAKRYPSLDAYERPNGCGLVVWCRFCLLGTTTATAPATG